MLLYSTFTLLLYKFSSKNLQLVQFVLRRLLLPYILSTERFIRGFMVLTSVVLRPHCAVSSCWASDVHPTNSSLLRPFHTFYKVLQSSLSHLTPPPSHMKLFFLSDTRKTNSPTEIEWNTSNISETMQKHYSDFIPLVTPPTTHIQQHNNRSIWESITSCVYLVAAYTTFGSSSLSDAGLRFLFAFAWKVRAA